MLIVTVADDIVRILVLRTQILPEAQCLGGQPRLLQLYQYQISEPSSFRMVALKVRRSQETAK